MVYLHQVNNVCENDSKDYNKTDPPPSSLEKDCLKISV